MCREECGGALRKTLFVRRLISAGDIVFAGKMVRIIAGGTENGEYDRRNDGVQGGENENPDEDAEGAFSDVTDHGK